MVGALLGILIFLLVGGGGLALFMLRKAGVYGRHKGAGAITTG